MNVCVFSHLNDISTKQTYCVKCENKANMHIFGRQEEAGGAGEKTQADTGEDVQTQHTGTQPTPWIQTHHRSTLLIKPHACCVRTNHSIFRERATFPAFPASFYGNERISAAFCRTTGLQLKTRTIPQFTGVFESSTVNHLRLEDDYCFSWNIKLVLQPETDNVRHLCLLGCCIFGE